MILRSLFDLVFSNLKSFGICIARLFCVNINSDVLLMFIGFFGFAIIFFVLLSLIDLVGCLIKKIKGGDHRQKGNKKMKMYVQVEISKKSGSKYVALVLDLGYRKAFLSFDSNLCAEVLQISVQQLMTGDCGEYPVYLE